jgi:hypothetical protein
VCARCGGSSADFGNSVWKMGPAAAGPDGPHLARGRSGRAQIGGFPLDLGRRLWLSKIRARQHLVKGLGLVMPIYIQ